eukprot:m.59698 g.59698  ORF g.59698 m.59698 type:complete len:1227 (-) comp11265_c0_seq1:74-3754(-)
MKIVNVVLFLACLLQANAQHMIKTVEVSKSVGTNLGAHFVEITLSDNMGNTTAAWVDVMWRRRPTPNSSTTNCVLTVASSGEQVDNIVRTQINSSITMQEGASFVFEPVVTGEDMDWIANSGTASNSIVTSCSGADGAENPCWKAVDGVYEFSYGGSGEGWNANGGNETLYFDLGKMNETVSGFGIWSMMRSEDPQWYPVHDPGVVSLSTSTSAQGPWVPVLSDAPAPKTLGANGLMSFKFQQNFTTSVYRYWRFTIICRGSKSASNALSCNYGDHSWIKEVAFARGTTKSKNAYEKVYNLYYLPYELSGSVTGLTIEATYSPIAETANTTWIKANNLTPESLKSGAFRREFPQATNVSIQAEDEFESFMPMEMIATKEELQQTLQKFSSPVLFFPEDRRNQVKMFDTPPAKWILQNQQGSNMTGTAEPGEIFALQLGIWATKQALTLSTETVSWSSLTPNDEIAAAIPAENITSPNIEGITFQGVAFNQSKTLNPGEVGSFWLLVPIPEDATPGLSYTGQLKISSYVFNIRIDVNKSSTGIISNHGADDLWRMSRLSWLNSQIGVDRVPSAPYSPVTYTATSNDGYEVAISQNNRSLTVSPSSSGFEVVQSMSANGRSILASPISLGVTMKGGYEATFMGTQVSMLSHDAAGVVIAVNSSSSGVDISSVLDINYDGYVEGAIQMSSSTSTALENMTLQFEMPVAIATYMMGLGLQGRNRSALYPQGTYWNWTENVNRGRNMIWVGNTNAGLRVKFKDADNDWNSPLHCMNVSQPPFWAGEIGMYTGGISVSPVTQKGTILITAFTGPMNLQANKARTLNFDMLVTPVKELDLAQHFTRDRYYQYGYNGEADPQDIAAMGVKVLNLHQGVNLNPYINYPFDPAASLQMKNFSDTAKSLGVKSTCIYYTTRELSNRCYEMPTFMSMATEMDHVFDGGPGGGAPWLQEHLLSNYARRWSTGLAQGQVDAAIGDASLSRWVNYYVQGLSWLRDNGPKIDGLYLDELSFGRETMQRMRKAADVKPGALFDLHSCNKFQCGKAPYFPASSSMLIYMAHFAYLNSLWFGEGFNPDADPDYWLIEMSGLAFGIPAEQLSRPNLHRGMVFAEGARPAPELWMAWDSMSLTTPGTKIVGWWDDKPLATVSSADVKCSMYVVPSVASTDISHYVLAIASWHGDNITVSVDLDPSVGKVTASAPNITGFQPAQAHVDLQSITIAPASGYLLLLTPQS